MGLTICVMVAACQHSLLPVASPVANTEIQNTSGQTIIAGHTYHSILQQPAYKPWFDKNYDAYTVDTIAVHSVQAALRNNISMDIFLGSWCGDSKREVPRMLKILDAAGMDTSKVSLVFVDNSTDTYKQSPAHEEKNRNIHHVPTFIIYRDQKEAGRIVESPVASLEKDLLAILEQKEYSPNYKAISYWVNRIAGRNKPMSDEKLQELAITLKPLCKHYGEFNAYGYVQLAAKSHAEALNVFRLNTFIYPQTPGVFDSLGEALAKTGNKTAAIAAYEKVISLKPGDANALKALERLK